MCVDYAIFSINIERIRWFPLQLARFPAGERWEQHDVGHGIVATGHGALRLRSLIATLVQGLNCSLFPRLNWLHRIDTARRKCVHFRGLKQAAAKIYINGAKNTCFLRNMTNTFPNFFLINTSDIKQYSRIFTKTQIAKGTNAIQSTFVPFSVYRFCFRKWWNNSFLSILV